MKLKEGAGERGHGRGGEEGSRGGRRGERERELGLIRQRVDALYMYGLKRFKLCIWPQFISTNLGYYI